MKKIAAIVVIVLLFVLFTDKTADKKQAINGLYPWQVEMLANGKSRVFGIVLSETILKEVSAILNASPELALYDSKQGAVIEAYYKNILLGGLIGSFIFTLDIPESQLNKIKNNLIKKKKVNENEFKYELDKANAEQVKIFKVKNLVYLPTVQLDEETILERFGKPLEKIALKNKESGWHYLYPEKGLDLIYREEGKEMLQYVSPKEFNLLLEPLLFHQNLKR